MSYDYNAILGGIQQLRLKLIQNHPVSKCSSLLLSSSHVDMEVEKPSMDDGSMDSSTEDFLQQIVDQFADFSSKCPMTPLLWAQYAYDAGELMQHLLEGVEDEISNAVATRLKSNWETQVGILQLGVAEFPGCALLRRLLLEMHCRLFYMNLHVVTYSEFDKYAQEIQIKEAYHDAWFHVGRGSHRADDVHVLAIHQLYVSFLAFSITTKHEERKELILEAYLERAQSPMKRCNDSIMNDMKLFSQNHNFVFTEDDFCKIESVRRLEGMYFGILLALDEDVEVAMAHEGIAPSAQLLDYLSDTDHRGFIDWGNILRNQSQPITGNFLMGGGMLLSSNAFQKYAESLRKYENYQNNTTMKSALKHKRNQDEGQDQSILKEVKGIISTLVIPIYERAVSECPTVECLWIDYIQYLLSKKVEDVSLSTSDSITVFVGNTERLSNVTARAIRNCPYSLRLYGYRFNSLAGTSDFNPDTCLSIISQALQASFISVPQGALELYLSLITVLKERILSLISRTTSPKRFDEPEFLETLFKKAKKLDKDSQSSFVINFDHQLLPLLRNYGESLDGETSDEIRDLIDDIRDIFDAALNYLDANFPSWTLGKSELFLKRATFEAYLITPILLSLSQEEEDDLKELEDPILLYEKVVRTHIPPRPRYWRSYIDYLSTETFYQVSKFKLDCDVGPGVTVGARIRFVRGLFHRALSSTKNLLTSQNPQDIDDWHRLCEDFIEFEKAFGSETSIQHAMRFVSLKESNRKIHQDIPVDAVSSPYQIDNKTVTQQSTESNGRARKRLKPSEHEADNHRTQITGSIEVFNQTGEFKQGHSGTIVHKIRIGSLNYPAHPYTVRVTNLSPDAEDMDLVDVLRAYGPIVHARILREKHSQGRGLSRGIALVQFEEKSSVDNVLGMSGKIILKDQQLIIERSHQPAVNLVPSGMHRKNPPRVGKQISDSNGKKNESQHKSLEENAQMQSQESTHITTIDISLTTPQTALSFIPRSTLQNRKKSVIFK